MTKVNLYITLIISLSILVFAECGSHSDITEYDIQKSINGKSVGKTLNSWVFRSNEEKIIKILEKSVQEKKQKLLLILKLHLMI